MEDDSRKDSKKDNPPNILTFAVTIGLLAFLLSGELEGGLSGVQGFFLGVSVIILLFLGLGVLESSRKKVSPARREEVEIPSRLLVTQSDGEGISIQIRLGSESTRRVEAHHG